MNCTNCKSNNKSIYMLTKYGYTIAFCSECVELNINSYMHSKLDKEARKQGYRIQNTKKLDQCLIKKCKFLERIYNTKTDILKWECNRDNKIIYKQENYKEWNI